MHGHKWTGDAQNCAVTGDMGEDVAVPVKGSCTFTENTELKGTEQHLEEKQPLSVLRKKLKNVFQFCISIADS